MLRKKIDGDDNMSDNKICLHMSFTLNSNENRNDLIDASRYVIVKLLRSDPEGDCTNIDIQYIGLKVW